MGNPYRHPISTPVPELQGIASIAAPPMTDDLVGRLRSYADTCTGLEPRRIIAEAADHIAGTGKLVARIEALEGENRELSARLDDVQILLTPAGNEWSGTEPAWQSEAWHMIERTLSDQIDRAALAKDKSDG